MVLAETEARQRKARPGCLSDDGVLKSSGAIGTAFHRVLANIVVVGRET